LSEEKLVQEALRLDDQSQFFLLRPSELREFKRKCQSLNCEKVIEFVVKWMHSDDGYVVGVSTVYSRVKPVK
jgi:hypothetical protein